MKSDSLSLAQDFSGLPMEALIGGPLNAAANANAAMAITQTKFMLDTCFTVASVEGQAAVAPVAADPTATPPVEEVVGTPAIPAHDNYAPIMIVMTLSRGVITPGTPGAAGDQTATPPVPATPATAAIIQNVKTEFNLPMITIVPINSLAVETVDISFEMEVKSSYSEKDSKTTEKEVKVGGSFAAKVGWGPVSASIKGSASYDSKDASTHNTHYQKSNSAKYSVKVHAAQLPLPKGVNTIIETFTQSIQPITLS